jgi:hypothetical protein
LAALTNDIREDGRVIVPIVCWKEKKKSGEDIVIDGAHRCVIASDQKLGSIPIRYESFESEEDADAAVERINDVRRQSTQQQVEARKRARIDKVEELRRQGESTRAIAKKVGASQSQVQRDLASTESGGSVGAVKGTDGKERSAKAVICKRCKRLGGKPVKGCKQCERARNQKAGAAAKKKAAEAQADAKLDCFKTPVPAKLCGPLFDPWIQTTIDFLEKTSAAFRGERLMDRMAKKEGKYPFFNRRDFVDGCALVIQYMDQLLDHLRENRPAAVCPSCEGKTCGHCKMSGLVPRTIHAEITKAATK